MDLYTEHGDPYRGVAFREYRQLKSIDKRTSPLKLLPAEDGTPVVHWVVGEHDIELEGKPAPTGLPGRPPGCGPVTAAVFDGLTAHVEEHLTEVATGIEEELRKRFPINEQLEALCIVYPQFHLADEEHDEEVIEEYVSRIIAQWGTERELADGTKVPAMLDGNLLRQQQSDFFKLAPVAARRASEAREEHLAQQTRGRHQRRPGEEDGYQEDHAPALITLMWRTLAASPTFLAVLSEWAKVAQDAIAMVGGSVSDEGTFRYMTKVMSGRESLTTNLEVCVRFAEWSDKRLSSFPLEQVLGMSIS